MPRPLLRRLPGFEIRTEQDEGWGRLKNGDLLRRAEGSFDAFLTADQNLKYQQNMGGRRLALLVLSTNRWPQVKAATNQIAAALMALKPGDYVELEI